MSPVGTGDAELLPQGCVQARDVSARGNNEAWRAVELVPAGMSVDEQEESDMTVRLKKLKDQVMVITGASSAGARINIGAEVSERAVPVPGMCSASKQAVQGSTDALRMELEKAKDPISVTLVKPSATDTPFPQHAKTYLEEEPKLPTPIY